MEKQVKKAIEEIKEHSKSKQIKKREEFLIEELGQNLYTTYKAIYSYSKHCYKWEDVIDKMYLDMKGWK